MLVLSKDFSFRRLKESPVILICQLLKQIKQITKNAFTYTVNVKNMIFSV